MTPTNASGSCNTVLAVIFRLVCYPPVPKQPSQHRRHASPSCHGHKIDPFLKYTNKTEDEDDDGAHLLDDDCRIGDERPEVVGLDPWVALETLEKRGLVGIVVWIYQNVRHNAYSTSIVALLDCFTHNSFFHVFFDLLVLLRLSTPSL